jgi:tetratricopeptide (TPR) repeat protein
MSATDGAAALTRRAEQLLRSGPLPDAIDAHERLLAVRPDLSDAWYNLGYLQRLARHFDSALASYAQALERGIAGPEEVHLNRAVILADHLQRDREAEAELRAALALRPGYVPAWLNLGNLHEDRGARDAAREAYAEALALDPANTRALARLAALSPPDNLMISWLRAALDRPGASADARAEIGFALGQALDAAGDYDEAFAAFEAANRHSRAAAPPAAIYDPAAQERLIDAIIEAFPAPAPAAPSQEAPVFILGMFRSGSTLVEQILAAHSQVAAGGELEFLPALVQAELQPYPEAAAGVPPDLLERLRDSYLDGVRNLFPDARLVTDKRPDNFLHVGLIKALFPSAKIVHTRREPLDNILSVYFLHFHHNVPYGTSLADAAHWYRQYRRLMSHWTTLYPNDIHDVEYEALVADPRTVIGDLLAFLGLDWEEACLSFHQAPNSVRTASVWQVRKPLYGSSAGRWRNYESHLAPLREALGEAAAD